MSYASTSNNLSLYREAANRCEGYTAPDPNSPPIPCRILFDAAFIGILSTHVPEDIWAQCLETATKLANQKGN
jgi:hypothetical protein